MKKLNDFNDFRVADADLDAGGAVDFERMMAIIRRQWRVVTSSVVFAILLGLAYLATAVPTYESSASVLIDPGSQKLMDQLSVIGGVLGDASAIESQVELLRSEKVALIVSKKLDLRNDKAFNAVHANPISTVIGFVRSYLDLKSIFSEGEEKVESVDAVQANIVEELLRNLTVARAGQSYVLQITYSSTDPQLAAKIAGAYADSYLTDQLDSKYEATRRTSDWLQLRITELKQKSLETDMAVQRFKSENGLVMTSGELISDQQLTQLNSQLIIAQAETANAEAKYRRIRSIVDSGDVEAAVTDALESSVINNLREKYLEASRREAEIATRVGENHIQAVRLRKDMSEYKRLMFDELSRIAESYRSSYEVAQSRQKALEDQVSQASGITATANDAQVQLRELEREAQTYRNLYQVFLQRFQEAIQQQTFPVTEARIISKAQVPDKPSSPRKTLVLAAAIIFGLGLGTMTSAAFEFRDRFFRTGDQIREELDLEFLGAIPLSENTMTRRSSGSQKVEANPRVISKGSSLSNFVVEHPLSSFAETLRSAKLAVDLAPHKKQAKCVGFVSCLPGEGKSTVSINFAELLATQGARVLLIDADLRNPGATRQLAGPQVSAGIVEALQSGTPLQDLLLLNPATKLAFLPAIIRARIPFSSELLASEAMDKLLASAREVFDYVIIDLPPMAPVVDARAVSSKVDAYVMVVEWGKITRAMVRRTLQNNPGIAAKCAGVILNKVNSKKMKLYQAHGSYEFYASRYSSYYTD